LYIEVTEKGQGHRSKKGNTARHTFAGSRLKSILDADSFYTVYLLKLDLHLFGFVVDCCRFCCTTNPQQIEQVKFELYVLTSLMRKIGSTDE